MSVFFPISILMKIKQYRRIFWLSCYLSIFERLLLLSSCFDLALDDQDKPAEDQNFICCYENGDSHQKYEVLISVIDHCSFLQDEVDLKDNNEQRIHQNCKVVKASNRIWFHQQQPNQQSYLDDQ